MTLIDQLNTALEQIALLKAQNAQLETLNARHVESLERICEERDAARGEIKALGWASDDLREALKHWELNESSQFWIDETFETKNAYAVLKAYRAARNGGAI